MTLQIDPHRKSEYIRSHFQTESFSLYGLSMYFTDDTHKFVAHFVICQIVAHSIIYYYYYFSSLSYNFKSSMFNGQIYSYNLVT